MTQLAKARKRKCISQTEVAKRIGVTPGAVSLAEKQGLTTMRGACRYAKALGCDPFFLLEDISSANNISEKQSSVE
jgi:transcriptional regulator with XRE-family HTH domain